MYLNLEKVELYFSANLGSQTIGILTNYSGKIIADFDAEWLYIDIAEGVMTVSVTENLSGEKRYGSITVSVPAVSWCTVNVTQASLAPSGDEIWVSPSSWVFSKDGGSKDFQIIAESNGWEVDVVGTGFSITGREGNVITVMATANPDESVRRGKLTVNNGENSAVAEFEQRGTLPAELFEVETSYIGPAGGNTAELQLVFTTQNGDQKVCLLVYVPETDFDETMMMPAEVYPVSASGQAGTILQSSNDSGHWTPSYVEIGDSKLVAIRDGKMTLELSGDVYTMTLDAMGIDVKNGDTEEHVYYTYTGEINFDVDPIGSELDFEDIPENSYTAFGTPYETAGEVAALSSWTGGVTHGTDSTQYPYYKFSNFGMREGENVPFFIRYYPEEKDIALILDAGTATQTHLYILNVFFNENGVWHYIPAAEASDIVIRPVYSKATRTLSLAGLQVDGRNAYFGINAYDRSTGEYSHALTAVYNDLVVNLSDTRYTPFAAADTAVSVPRGYGTPVYIGPAAPEAYIP